MVLWLVSILIILIRLVLIILLVFLGTISQTLTYPFDVLRRKMQVTGMKDGAVKYAGAVDALRSILRVEGVAGLYRGLWPNLRKWRVLKSDSLYINEDCMLQLRLRQVLLRHFSRMSW